MSHSPQIIFFMGIAGSGKGTQARLLNDTNGFELIETGTILRKIAGEDTERGKSIKKRLDDGQHMADEEITPLIEEELESLLKEKEHIIIDGYARRKTQAQDAIELMRKLKISDVSVVLVEGSDDIARKRMERRQRHDDTPDAIKHRLDYFHDSVEPAIAHLATAFKLVTINGDQPEDNVHKDIVKALSL